jgi:hypothetical protein
MHACGCDVMSQGCAGGARVRLSSFDVFVRASHLGNHGDNSLIHLCSVLHVVALF